MRLLALAAALSLLPGLAAGQTANLVERGRADPVGLALTGVSVAGAEEPTALALNPAGVGFVGAANLQYFHEGGAGYGGDGAYAALPIGPLVPALSMEWVRPAPGGGPRFRKTGLALALAGGQVVSVGVAWNLYSSPDAALSDLMSVDLGLTFRPWRYLSLGASVLGLEGRLAGQALPVRYDFGLATRLLSDSLTASGDLYCDDGGRGSFYARHGAVGLGLELAAGVGLQAQYQFPLHPGRAGFDGESAAILALTASTGNAGVTAGATGYGPGVDRDRGWLVGARISAERYRALPAGGVAPEIDLEEALERPGFRLFGRAPDPYGALLARLADIRDDPGVPGLVLRIGELPVGEGRAEELRAAVAAVRERKPVVAYLEGGVGGGPKEYLLATGASAVYAPPGAEILVNGVSYTAFYLKDGLARLGIAVEAVATGPYKTAADVFTRSDMSAGEREVAGSLLDDRYARQVRVVAAARSLPEAIVRRLLDVGVFSAEEARDARLLDGTIWPDEIEEVMRRMAGRGVRVSRAGPRTGPREAQRWGPRPRIAVIPLQGLIAPGKSRRAPLGVDALAGAETVTRAIRAAAESRSVRAIVLRIDSPGGDAQASDLVWRAVAEARRRGKPVVVSLGDYGASGGYLSAVAADAIVAEPSTLTGSIGVVFAKPDLSGLLQKLGVGTAALQRGEHARIRSLVKPLSPDEHQLVERQVEAMYRTFLARVAEGRKLPREEVERLAAGRVWTGEQALARRLVDRLGSLADAVELARTRAGLAPDEAEVVRIEDRPTGLAEELADIAAGAGASPVERLAAEAPELRALAALSEMGPFLALPPAWFEPPSRP